MIDLPVRYLSPVELAVASLLFFALCLTVLFYVAVGSLDIAQLLAFLTENLAPLVLLAGLLSLMALYFYSLKSIRVIFDDIRGGDRLLDHLASQIGYSRQLRENNTLVLKPSLYHFILYSARKIRAVFDGNAVVPTGNTMYIRKLLKVLRSFQNPG